MNPLFRIPHPCNTIEPTEPVGQQLMSFVQFLASKFREKNLAKKLKKIMLKLEEGCAPLYLQIETQKVLSTFHNCKAQITYWINASMNLPPEVEAYGLALIETIPSPFLSFLNVFDTKEEEDSQILELILLNAVRKNPELLNTTNRVEDTLLRNLRYQNPHLLQVIDEIRQNEQFVISPYVIYVDLSQEKRYKVIKYFAQFFLSIGHYDIAIALPKLMPSITDESQILYSLFKECLDLGKKGIAQDIARQIRSPDCKIHAFVALFDVLFSEKNGFRALEALQLIPDYTIQLKKCASLFQEAEKENNALAFRIAKHVKTIFKAARQLENPQKKSQALKSVCRYYIKIKCYEDAFDVARMIPEPVEADRMIEELEKSL
ncbi:hypothetical protein PHSC3_000175 [Chlamydiales bacterium STE3]|nr:hypothetical protein PHSC3_000175 [Chlamydiales bacterium STE3]